MEVISHFIGKKNVKFEIYWSNGGTYMTIRDDNDKVTIALNNSDFLEFSYYLPRKKEEEFERRVKKIVESIPERDTGYLPGTVEEKVFNW